MLKSVRMLHITFLCHNELVFNKEVQSQYTRAYSTFVYTIYKHFQTVLVIIFPS